MDRLPYAVSLTRRQLALPGSWVTPLSTCPALRPRWCPIYIAIAYTRLLPSITFTTSAFLTVSRELSSDHK